MTRNYVGLACTFHDPALAIVNSRGEVVYAEAAERLYQIKRGLHCPPDTLSYLDRVLGTYCEPDAALTVAKSWSLQHPLQLRTYEFFRSIWGLLTRGLSSRSRKGAAWRYMSRSMVHSMLLAGEGVRRHQALAELERAAREGNSGVPANRLIVTGFDHHHTHAVAACFTSPFQQAVCAVVDGFGESSTTAFYAYQDGNLRPLRSGRSNGSLGFFYAELCDACGFDSAKGEEWKVMGLAPYGKRDPVAYERMKGLLRIDGLRVVAVARSAQAEQIWSDLSRMPPADLACTGQFLFEEWMSELLGNLAALGISENLVLGGGCALNSSYNGMILDRTPFKHLHVFAAPADDGNALGAALLAYRNDNPQWMPSFKLHTPYLGSSLSREALKNLVRFDTGKRVTEHTGTIHKVAARALAEGKIIGWAQGRAEYGPRALGNRSILADARRPTVKDEINGRVKFREEFRPFAPAILDEHGPEYFEGYQQAPYMERTLRFRPEVIDRVPGVVHVNNTGRLQTVRRDWNERFHGLVQEFYQLTGVPLVLNTSFNVMGKPIIHSIEDAIAVLHTTGLDAIALEDYWVEK